MGAAVALQPSAEAEESLRVVELGSKAERRCSTLVAAWQSLDSPEIAKSMFVCAWPSALRLFEFSTKEAAVNRQTKTMRGYKQI